MKRGTMRVYKFLTAEFGMKSLWEKRAGGKPFRDFLLTNGYRWTIPIQYVHDEFWILVFSAADPLVWKAGFGLPLVPQVRREGM